MTAHTPDTTKLSKAVTGWKPIEDGVIPECESGCQLLLAIPMGNKYPPGIFPGGIVLWHYEYHAVTVECDEHYFKLIDADGEDCDWTLDECDFYAVLSE